MTLVALHPETVRTAVLDSIYPPDRADAVDQRRRRARCVLPVLRWRSSLRRRISDLAATYRETVSGLARAPLIVAMPPETHLPDDRVSLTSTLFETLVSRLIYYPTAYPSLPRLIATVHHRDSQGSERFLRLRARPWRRR